MAHKGGVIRFEVPKINSKLVFHMYVVPMKCDVTFRVVEDKAVTPEKPIKPDVKPDSKPSNMGKEKPVQDGDSQNKPSKPQEKPVIKPQPKPTEDKKEAKETIVKVKALKAENNEPSMSGTYLGKEAKYTEENGKTYCEVNLLALDWMQNIKIEVDGKKVEHTQKETGAAEVMGMAHKGGVIRFEVPKINSKLVFHMYVVPMKCDVTFRVVEDKAVKPDSKPQEKPSKPEEKPTKPDTKPSNTGKEKTMIYEIASKIEVKAEDKKIINKYIDLDELQKKIDTKVENGKKYVTLKIKGKTDDITIRVNGYVVHQEIIGEKLDKLNRLASGSASGKVNKPEEITFIRFEVPNTEFKKSPRIEIKIHDKELKRDVDVAFNLDTKKEQTDSQKPSEKPAEKPTTKPSTKPNGDTSKPAKPENRPEAKKEVTKNIKVKALKEKSNEPSMAGEYLDKNVVCTEKNGKKYFTITVTRIDWMKNIDISVNGRNVNYDKKESGKTAELTFEVNGENSEVMLHMNVVPMGNARVAFRVVKDETNTKPTTNSKSDKENKVDDKKDEDKKEKDKLKINANEEGKYKVNIDALKKDCDEKSMAGQYLNSTANYEVKNGTKYITLTLNRMDWMKNVTVYVNGDKKKYEEKSIGKNRSEIKFETDGIGAEIKLEMNVVPMGNARVTFRVVPKKSSLELIKKYDDKVDSNKENKDDNKTSNKVENDKDNNKTDNIAKPNSNKENYNKDTTQKPADTNKSSEKVTKESNKNKDGLYEVNIKALKEKSNEPSMAGTYLGDKVKVQIKNGKKYAIVTFNRSDWMKNIDVLVNDKSQKYDVVNVKTNNAGEKTSTIKLEIPSLDSEVKFKMNVEPMGNARVTFRMLMQKDSLKFLEGNEYDPNKAEEYLNNLAIGSKENKNSKSSSHNSSDNNNHNQSTIAEKKLPKTGLPFSGGLVASIGGILSGLGITLMKKNKKRGE
ncbi:NEAT domain-containing protein [Clostridium novyi]|nr:NEAT domain-containing protein [Clostridium novyi]